MCYIFVPGLRKIGDAEDGEGLTHRSKKYTPPACLSHVFTPVLLFYMYDPLMGSSKTTLNRTFVL